MILRRCRSNGSPRSTPSWALSSSRSKRLASSCSGSSWSGSLRLGRPARPGRRSTASPTPGPRGTSRRARRCGRTRKLSAFIEAISLPQQRRRPRRARRRCSAMASRVLRQLEPGLEDLLAQRRRSRSPRPEASVLAEVLEVLAEVEDVEDRLVVAGPEQVRAQAGAAADHLPELGLRADQLEEHEVDDLGHVDAGVEHVDRDGDVRRLVRDREVVDQALGVLGAVGDDPGEVAVVECG